MSFESPPKKLTPEANCFPPDSADQTHLEGGTVILQPITMRIPNCHGVYSPSQLRPPKVVSYREFLSRYANHPRRIQVCFDETPSPATIVERSDPITAYSFGLDCWYIVAAYYSDENDQSESETTTPSVLPYQPNIFSSDG
jgi:hypothetical protein